MSKFIIFANARSGSTSLARLLDSIPKVKLCMEPFHPDYSNWNKGERNYSKYIKDKETLEDALLEIFDKFNAIKVLNYQFDESIYRHLMLKKDLKIIFLHRKKVVNSAISSLVAKQTNAWHREEADKLGYKIYDNLKPIRISEIKKITDYTTQQNQLYLDILKKERQGEYIEVFYEELYSVRFEVNKRKILEICKFLDIEIPSDDAIEKYMNPHKAQINAEGIYKKIPNLKEIEQAYGKLY